MHGQPRRRRPVVTGLDDALRRADEALYRAKSLGRNRVEVAWDGLTAVPAEVSAVVPPEPQPAGSVVATRF